MLHKKSKIFPPKVELCYNSEILNQIESNDFNLNLISNLLDIFTIYKSYKNDSFKIFYFNKNHIHNMLFEEEESVKIDKDNKKKNLSDYFYLSSLILDNPYVVFYEYPFDFIYELINYQKSIDNNLSLKKIIISKIVSILVKNYIEMEQYDEEKEGDELKKIKNDNLIIIKNNISIFNQLGINLNELDIKLKSIEEIYKIIIIAMIKKNFLYDYDNICKIFEELDLESIDLDNKIVNNIGKNLANDPKYNKENSIKYIEDLFNLNKINYYYVLLKYIIKNPLYIYTIPIFFQTRKIIIRSIKILGNNSSVLDLYLKSEIKDKIEFVIKKICDTEYYYNMLINKINLIKLNEILKYYKENLGDSKKEEIETIEKVINKKKYDPSCDIYLDDLKTALDVNKKNREREKLYYSQRNERMKYHFFKHKMGMFPGYKPSMEPKPSIKYWEKHDLFRHNLGDDDFDDDDFHGPDFYDHDMDDFLPHMGPEFLDHDYLLHKDPGFMYHSKHHFLFHEKHDFLRHKDYHKESDPRMKMNMIKHQHRIKTNKMNRKDS